MEICTERKKVRNRLLQLSRTVLVVPSARAQQASVAAQWLPAGAIGKKKKNARAPTQADRQNSTFVAGVTSKTPHRFMKSRYFCTKLSAGPPGCFVSTSTLKPIVAV